MLVTPTGRFPIVRNGRHPLRSAVESWRARGDTTPESASRDPELVEAQIDAQRDLIAEQEAAGVDVLGDGYVPIYDEWFAWLPAIGGVGDSAPIRYLDTNTYYHRWHLVETPWRLGPGPLVAAYQRAVDFTTRPVKPCLFGPYTLWAYALKDGAAAAGGFDALVEIWIAEVLALAAAGARYIQLDESLLLRPKHRGDIGLVSRAIERIAAAVPNVTLMLHLAGGVVDSLLEPLLAIRGLGGLGLDFTDVHREPNLAVLSRWSGELLLQAGVADARHVRIESQSELHELFDAITRFVPADRCFAAPSTALLYLPRHVAFEKLAALAAAAHSFVSREALK